MKRDSEKSVRLSKKKFHPGIAEELAEEFGDVVEDGAEDSVMVAGYCLGVASYEIDEARRALG